MPKADKSMKVSAVGKRSNPERSTTKGTKNKAAKDPNYPKRPSSAFMYFCKDWRERIKAENPEANFADQGKLLGAKWKELEEEEKKPYMKEAATDKTRYNSAKEAYEANLKAAAPATSGDEQGE